LCSQFYKQLMLGVQQDPIAGQYEHDIFPLELDGEDMSVPLQLHAIAWWDEHHKKCVLGPVCKRETRIWQDEAGVPTKQEDGGCCQIRRGRLPPSLSKRLEVALVWQCGVMTKDTKGSKRLLSITLVVQSLV
jgi:hypothetical protein